jgi:hypothetical protein
MLIDKPGDDDPAESERELEGVNLIKNNAAMPVRKTKQQR